MMKQQQGRMSEEEMLAEYRRQAQNSIPPKRSFEVIRRAYEVGTNGILYPLPHEGSEKVLVEAHSYLTHDSGALVFNTHFFSETGMQGPGIYTRATLTLAPGTWWDCREATAEMQLRPSSVS